MKPSSVKFWNLPTDVIGDLRHLSLQIASVFNATKFFRQTLVEMSLDVFWYNQRALHK